MKRTIAVQDLEKHIGQELGVSEWMVVDQERIDLFARATGDFQWIHVDVERATREMGATIAHGYLVLSLLPVLHESVLEITGVDRGLNYGLNKVRFTGMTPAGSRLRLRETLLGVEAKGDGVLATYQFVIEIEGGERPVCVAEALGLMIPAENG